MEKIPERKALILYFSIYELLHCNNFIVTSLKALFKHCMILNHDMVLEFSSTQVIVTS